jgi:hypothetical protein
MVLKGHSDASYLGETNARSRAGGIFYYDNRAPPYLVDQGAVDVTSVILPSVAASAAEAEYGALFINGQNCAVLRNTAADLRHPQRAPTEITSDNACAVGVVNNAVKQRRSKAFDMRYHWIRDRVGQGHFKIVWGPGAENRADFVTKNHPVHHHISESRRYVHYPTTPP